MGNSDLIIIINGEAFLVLGDEYKDQMNAIELAVVRFHTEIDGFIADIYSEDCKLSPEEKQDRASEYSISKVIKKIEVYTI